MKSYVRSSDLRPAWPALSLLAGGQLLLAVLSSSPLVGNLATSFGHRPALGSAAAGDWLNLLAELPGATLAGTAQSPDTEASISGAVALTVLASTIGLVLHALVYTFASGALLASMSGVEQSLWRGGARLFFPMLRLGLWLLVVIMVLGGAAAAGVWISPLPVVAKAAAWLVWFGLIGTFFELARAQLPADNSRSARRALAKAFLLLIRRPVAVLRVWLLLAFGNVVIFALIAALSLALTATNPILAWGVTVLTVTLGSAYKLLRLAVQLRLAAASKELL